MSNGQHSNLSSAFVVRKSPPEALEALLVSREPTEDKEKQEIKTVAARRESKRSTKKQFTE